MLGLLNGINKIFRPLGGVPDDTIISKDRANIRYKCMPHNGKIAT
jgi:hypothetical protein